MRSLIQLFSYNSMQKNLGSAACSGGWWYIIWETMHPKPSQSDGSRAHPYLKQFQTSGSNHVLPLAAWFFHVCTVYFPDSLSCPLILFLFTRALTFVYPFGATLNVMKPAVAVLSTGSICFPLNRPIMAFYQSKVNTRSALC